jgi:hypothetical protein
VPVRIELANPEGQAEAGDVRRRRHSGGRCSAGRYGAELGGHRQRQPAGRHRATGRRALRATPGASSASAAADFVQVLEGVKEGELVVTAANFLIDAESNLKAALGGMQKAEASPAAKTGGSRAQGGGHAECHRYGSRERDDFA